MAEVALEGTLPDAARVAHPQWGANELRVAGLRRMVQEVMENLNVDEIIIE